jgi:hypothetical protein
VIHILASLFDGRWHAHACRAQIVLHLGQILHRAADQIRRLAADAGSVSLRSAARRPDSFAFCGSLR